MKTSDSIFLRALNKESLKTPPIWYMRQAGRYMPEYRAVRKKFKNFLDMCKNPEVCCELALQPINAFNLDASILFSDILTIPDAFGLGVETRIGAALARHVRITHRDDPIHSLFLVGFGRWFRWRDRDWWSGFVRFERFGSG